MSTDAPDIDDPDSPLPSNVHRLPRKPRFTDQDMEDFSDSRRYLTLNGAVKWLAQMQRDLSTIFQETLQVEGPWPFRSVRKLQDYVEKQELGMLTASSQVLDSAIVYTQKEITQRTEGLARALFGRAGEAMDANCGFDMKKDGRLLREVERTIAQIIDLVEETDEVAHEDLEAASRITTYSLRSMYGHGGKIPEFGKAKLRSVSGPAVEGYNPERRKLLNVAEHWTGLSNAEIKLMKLALIADYAAAGKTEGPRQRAQYMGEFVLATANQSNFIKADAQAYRDLGSAHKTLYQALIH